MISKRDLLRWLWAFLYNHLFPTLVCSVGTQQTSFRICSTDLYVNGKMGENIIEIKFLQVTVNMSICIKAT